MQITPSEAIQLSREHNVTIGALEAEFGFVVVSGAANVETAKAVAVNAELLAHVEALYKAGRSVPDTRGKSPRSKRVLGDADGIAPYRIIVTKAK